MDQPERGSAEKKAIQLRQRGWLLEIVKSSGDTLAQVAAKAGVSDTTLSRLANNPSYSGVLSAVSIERITGAYQVPGPEEYGGQRRAGFPGFSEAERYEPAGQNDGLSALVSAMIAARRYVFAWRLKTEALEEAGYLAGDILIVDENAAPMAQDVVCARVFDWKGGSAQTVWRVFDPPYLVGASRDRTAYKPLLIDNERVTVRGVVERMLRPHRLSEAR